jgi:hypothetical protein
LKQVREAVSGYRSVPLDAELSNARLACEAADISLDVHVDEVRLPAEQESHPRVRVAGGRHERTEALEGTGLPDFHLSTGNGPG